MYLIQEAIAESGIAADVAVLEDGQQATEFIDNAGTPAGNACPDLVLLDINLPRKSGDEVLTYLRACGKCKNTRVLVVTSSDSAHDRKMAAALAANGYFRKPSTYNEYMQLGRIIKELLGPSGS